MRHVDWLGEPIEQEDVCMSNRQMRSHVFWETAALVVQVPFMAYLAASPALHPVVRIAAGGIGITTLIVDGRLLRENRKKLKESSS